MNLAAPKHPIRKKRRIGRERAIAASTFFHEKKMLADSPCRQVSVQFQQFQLNFREDASPSDHFFDPFFDEKRWQRRILYGMVLHGCGQGMRIGLGISYL